MDTLQTIMAVGQLALTAGGAVVGYVVNSLKQRQEQIAKESNDRNSSLETRLVKDIEKIENKYYTEIQRLATHTDSRFEDSRKNLAELRVEIRELATKFSILETNLQRNLDALLNSMGLTLGGFKKRD